MSYVKARFLSKICPGSENSLSHSAVVGSVARYFWAIMAMTLFALSMHFPPF